MKYEVELTAHFKKEAKRLLKKFPSLKKELSDLVEVLGENPEFGIPLGNSIFKIRLAISSKGRGKSGGARIISYFAVSESIVLLLSIYNKGDKDSITDFEIKEILSRYL